MAQPPGHSHLLTGDGWQSDFRAFLHPLRGETRYKDELHRHSCSQSVQESSLEVCQNVWGKGGSEEGEENRKVEKSVWREKKRE